jgi:predicted O-methyltransferase YrrM
MNKIDEYLTRTLTKRDMEETNKILGIRRELASQDRTPSLKDYGFRPDGSKANRTMGEICNKMGLASKLCINIFNIVRSMKPKMCLELGTGIGISGSYIASALKLNRNNGKLITIEGDETLTDLSKDVFDNLGLENVSVVNSKFDEAIQTILQSNDTIDLVFCDGDHNEQRTFDYYKSTLGGMQDGSVYILDDIRWSAGMRRAWERICHHREVNEYKDMNRLGVCLIERWKSRGRIGID